MAASDLTAQRLREVLDYDPASGIFTRKVIRGNMKKHPGSFQSTGYLQICVDGALYYAQRLAWLYVHGEWPQNKIDHINGIRTDNRISNLRDAPSTINAQNRRKGGGITGYLGVHKKRGRYVASIRTDGKLKQIGSFATPEEAHVAYVAHKRLKHPGCTI